MHDPELAAERALRAALLERYYLSADDLGRSMGKAPGWVRRNARRLGGRFIAGDWHFDAAPGGPDLRVS